MSKRINFSAWGRGLKSLELPAYAMDDGVRGRAACVADAIARKNGLGVATLRQDGVALDRHGDPESQHYQTTLARPCRGGGWTPVAEIWFSIPVAGGRGNDWYQRVLDSEAAEVARDFDRDYLVA